MNLTPARDLTQVERPEDSRRWVSFLLGKQQYAASVMRVLEVLRCGHIEPVPGAPYGVLGIINLRGNIVTVVSARNGLGLEEQPGDDETRILIVNRAHEIVGIKVDTVADVIELESAEIDSAPRVDMAGRPGSAFGVAIPGEQLTIFIDLDKLLAAITGAS